MLTKEELELIDEFLDKMHVDASPFGRRDVREIIIDLFDVDGSSQIERTGSGQVIYSFTPENNHD